MGESLSAWRDWQQQIAGVIAEASSLADVPARLAAWAKREARHSDVSESLYRSLLQSDLAGQLFVRTIEVPEATSVALAGNDRPSFLSMPFQEAIAYFRSKRLISPEAFAALDDAARMQAFTATELATDHLRRFAFEQLTRALEEGTTLQDFAAALRAEEISLGVTPSSAAYVENVYRTNVATAYGAGRFRQLSSPEVQTARPLLEYRTAGDTRVRPNHARLNGLVFRQSDPLWPTFAPPNGYQCRCSVVARRASDVDPRRIVDASSLGPEYQPDPGFAAAPAL